MARLTKETVDAAIAAMERGRTVGTSMIAFLNTLPEDTPLRDATAAAQANLTEVETALLANVPPPTP